MHIVDKVVATAWLQPLAEEKNPDMWDCKTCSCTADSASGALCCLPAQIYSQRTRVMVVLLWRQSAKVLPPSMPRSFPLMLNCTAQKRKKWYICLKFKRVLLTRWHALPINHVIWAKPNARRKHTWLILLFTSNAEVRSFMAGGPRRLSDIMSV